MGYSAKEVIAELRRCATQMELWLGPEKVAVMQGGLTEGLGLPDEQRLEFLAEMLEELGEKPDFPTSEGVAQIAEALLKKPLPLTEELALRILSNMQGKQMVYPYKGVLRSIGGLPRTEALEAGLRRLRASIDPYWLGGSLAKDLYRRIDELLGTAQPRGREAAGSWSEKVMEAVSGTEKENEWKALFLYWPTLTQSEPSKKWLLGAVELVEKIGREGFVEKAGEWLAWGPVMGKADEVVTEGEADWQKGFVWTVGALGETRLAAAMGDFAVACFKKIPQVGAVSHRVGNACVGSLSALPGTAAVAHLSRLSQRVKYDVAQRLIEKALTAAAVRTGMSRADLEAMSVPRFGLGPEGKREDLDKKTQKEFDRQLAVQRKRLESLLTEQPETAASGWRDWYLEHPVTGLLARRLIWEYQGEGAWHSAIASGGGLVDWAGAEVKPGDGARWRLWHPREAEVQTVLSWRCFLEDRGIQQPFKQAHREAYLLTAAERETGNFSQRFAGHLLRQHVFAALCEERGWQFRLMGQWDSHNNARREWKELGWAAEFVLDFAQEEAVSGHGIYLVIATREVRFWRGTTKARLEEVPAVLFSEAMRDVDLFVGVASIASDPAWNGGFQEYWQSQAFGELSTAAEHRGKLLEALLPKLKIGERCRIEGRFLHVRGEWNEYRIHLGSGNILMEPGSRYLCIVRGAGDKAAKVMLPFEQDATLETILSKALLLVDEKKIKDRLILDQLKQER